jgi:solute carrier family 13 (sodium-dependent dicarboxylate transporter), member 2/3/5
MQASFIEGRKMSEAAKAKKKGSAYYVHVAIGFAIIILFSYVLPAPSPITPIGMKVVGAFLGMVYLWSTIGALWPSLLGLFFVAISGVGGDSGFNGVWMNAIGRDTVLLTLYAMILFGAVDEVGDTLYITKWILTRKIFAGRPYVFFALFYFCNFVLSTLVSPISALIIMWPITLRIVEVIGLKREDAFWKFFFVGMFLVQTLGQPFFPFMGAQLIPCSAFKTMTGVAMPMLPYMLVNLIMTFLVMAVFLLLVKILRVDISKFKNLDPSTIEETLPLPPMNFQQKAYLWMIPLYLILLLVPSFLPSNPVVDFLTEIDVNGITIIFLLFFLIVKFNGKPMLDFKEVAYKQFDWGIFFMIAAAVYTAGMLSSDTTGVSAWLVEVLNPVLGGQSEMGFVAIMFTVALIITNFANNAAMAVVLMPVVIEFSSRLGISPLPVAMGVILMVFVAMLTPAASPHAGMMWGRKDIYSPKEIISVGLPMCIITLVMYIFIGYPLAKFLISAMGF